MPSSKSKRKAPDVDAASSPRKAVKSTKKAKVSDEAREATLATTAPVVSTQPRIQHAPIVEDSEPETEDENAEPVLREIPDDVLVRTSKPA
jgi:hypothetical protein